jgi:hypothetical protein
VIFVTFAIFVPAAVARFSSSDWPVPLAF